MKNEGRIMTEGVGGNMDKNVEKIAGNTGANEQGRALSEKPAVKDNTRIMQKPESSKKVQLNEGGSGDKEVRPGTEEVDKSETKEKQAEDKKFINLTPETEEKLKKFSVEIDKYGKKETNTAVDAVREMNVLSNKELTSEQRDDALLRSVALVDKLTQKYGEGSADGEELRNILFNEVFAGGNENKGQKVQEWFQSHANAIKAGGKIQIDANGLAGITGLQLDGSQTSELGELIKQVPLPEGVKAAPTITIDKDGKFTITPAPHGEDAGQVTPAPGEGEGIIKTETPEIPGTLGIKPADKKKEEEIEKEEKEKKKINWYKYGQGLLFLFILYLGAQGWYAGMWEKLAERAR